MECGCRKIVLTHEFSTSISENILKDSLNSY